VVPAPSRSRQLGTLVALLLCLVFVVMMRDSCSRDTGVFFQRMTAPPPR
jgi:hypothetical protein